MCIQHHARKPQTPCVIPKRSYSLCKKLLKTENVNLELHSTGGTGSGAGTNLKVGEKLHVRRRKIFCRAPALFWLHKYSWWALSWWSVYFLLFLLLTVAHRRPTHPFEAYKWGHMPSRALWSRRHWALGCTASFNLPCALSARLHLRHKQTDKIETSCTSLVLPSVRTSVHLLHGVRLIHFWFVRRRRHYSMSCVWVWRCDCSVTWCSSATWSCQTRRLNSTGRWRRFETPCVGFREPPDWDRLACLTATPSSWWRNRDAECRTRRPTNWCGLPVQRASRSTVDSGPTPTSLTGRFRVEDHRGRGATPKF